MKTIQLTKAFKELEQNDYFAKRKIACCQSCGVHVVPDEHTCSYVFTHDQDEADLKKTGICYLAWQAPDDNPKEIIKALKAQGIKVIWNKKPTIRIKIDLN